uniref:hypothetical protein n=1 Tax=Acetatifactor sp. TaxID=1872090 RepID=UPI0040578C96
MKKRKGSLIDFLPSVLVILCASILMFAFFTVVNIANYKENVKALARAYLLEMETVGYLPAASVTAFTQELTDMGVVSIDLSNTTLSPVGYGQPIYLELRCNIPAETLNTSAGDMMMYFFEDVSLPYSVTLKSTAKH